MLPNIHLLGIQGSGKGTQSALAVEEYGLTYLASGNLFRERAEVNDALGERIRSQLNRGRLLDDELLHQSVADFLSSHPIEKGLLCDGVTRTLSQYEALLPLWQTYGLDEPYIIHIDLSEKTALEHIRMRESRKNDPDLQNHHRKFSGKLLTRQDDNPQAIATRFQLYHQMTEPVITAASQRGACAHINGERSIEEVHLSIKAAIEDKYPYLHVAH